MLEAIESMPFIFPIAFALMGFLGMLAFGKFVSELFRLVQGLQSYGWTPVTARLTRREVVFEKGDSDLDTSDYYHVCIDYQYEMRNNTYTAHRVAFGLGEYYTQENQAQAMLQLVPLAPTLTVYVNPLFPKSAVIRRGRDLDSFLAEVAWLTFYVLGTLIFYIIYRQF
ncbi:MAG: DUF3592 domain-containing protein [Phototrophicaceae bacterium]